MGFNSGFKGLRKISNKSEEEVTKGTVLVERSDTLKNVTKICYIHKTSEQFEFVGEFLQPIDSGRLQLQPYWVRT